MSKMVTFGELVGYNKAKMEAAKAKTAERKALAKKPGPETSWIQFREARERKDAWLSEVRGKLENTKAARAKLSPEKREELDGKLLAVASNGATYVSAADLISEGANPFATDDLGQSVAETAFYCAQSGVARVLRRYGAMRTGPVIDFNMD